MGIWIGALITFCETYKLGLLTFCDNVNHLDKKFQYIVLRKFDMSSKICPKGKLQSAVDLFVRQSQHPVWLPTAPKILSDTNYNCPPAGVCPAMIYLWRHLKLPHIQDQVRLHCIHKKLPDIREKNVDCPSQFLTRVKHQECRGVCHHRQAIFVDLSPLSNQSHQHFRLQEFGKNFNSRACAHL